MAQVSRPLYTLEIMDYSKESQSFSIYTPVITDVNYAAVTANLAAYEAAVDALSIGIINTWTTQLNRVQEDPQVVPINPYAQRELKWRVVYSDNVTAQEYSFLIPCPDTTDNLRPQSDEADITSTDWIAFISAFETAALSPEGNNVSFVSASLVGRNS